MNVALSAPLDAIAEVSLVLLADILVTEYEADSVALADTLAPDSGDCSLLHIVETQVIRAGYKHFVTFSHLSHLL